MTVMEEKWALFLFGNHQSMKTMAGGNGMVSSKNFSEEAECWLQDIFQKKMDVHTQ